MAHSFVLNRVHVVFSTRDRQPTIFAELQPKLWAYMRGIARNHKMDMLAIGGVEDHVHLLIGIPADLALAKAVQLLKGNSSKWLNESSKKFAWQQGYGAFSVSASLLKEVCAYINTQPEHHKRYTYEQEFVSLLKKHGVTEDLDRALG